MRLRGSGIDTKHNCLHKGCLRDSGAGEGGGEGYDPCRCWAPVNHHSDGGDKRMAYFEWALWSLDPGTVQ